MRGDNNKIRAYMSEYGVEFCLEAIEKAVKLKNAQEMIKQKQTINKQTGASEARIILKAKEIGVRIG